MTEVVKKLKSRGYWKVVIRPCEFKADRLTRFAELESAIRECAVSLRGWNFPHFDYRIDCTRTLDWTGQEIIWEHYTEMWRAYKSGQFVSLSGIWGDWRDQSGLWPIDTSWKPGNSMGACDAVFRFTEIFEFAARFSRSKAGSDNLFIGIYLYGLKNRQLVMEKHRAGFFNPKVSKVAEWKWEKRLLRTKLHTGIKEQALEPAIQLFEIFGVDVGEAILSEIQNEIFTR